MNTSVTGFFSVINSSKVTVTELPVNLVAKSGGSQRVTLGGVTSLGPPVGETWLAQRTSNNAVAIEKKKNKSGGRCTRAKDFRKFATPNLPIVFHYVTFFY